MKKWYALLVVVLIGYVGIAQIINIPDANFKAKLLSASATVHVASLDTPDIDGQVSNYSQIDTNNDGEIEVNEAIAIQWLNVDNNNISDLTGIEFFTQLQTLSCNNNLLTVLNVSGLTNIQHLYFTNNYLISIDISALTNLKDLDCSNNHISSLNLSGLTNLKGLYCSNNQLSSLNISNLTNLGRLDCSINQLSSLNVSTLTNLKTLNCDSNQIPSLNLSGLTNLYSLSFSLNPISSIDVSGLINLQNLYCTDNQLTSLNLSGLTNLYYLACSNNQLTSIDVSGLTNFKYLYCGNNQLNYIYVKNGSSEYYIDFSSNPNLQYICADEEQILTIQNLITQYGYTNCHVNSYCSFTPGGTFYSIKGNDRFDEDNNGCSTADLNYPYLMLSFTDGTNTGNLIPDASGAYQYDVQAGTQTFTPTLENPAYFTISPTTATVTFPTTTSPFTQDFCIAANGVHNDLEVAIFPMGSARPGFDATYQIVYKNKGTAVQSGTVALTYAGVISSLVSATPTTASQAANTLNWNFTALQPFETRTIWVTLHIHSPTDTPPANAGNGIIYVASVTGSSSEETPADNTVSFDQTLVNSFDPNEKTCTEGQFLPTYNIGNYLHYVIHFENTGTAAAQHIVVKDIIDTTKFDISTLVPLVGSANFTTRIINTNQVEFIFQNINLPFAAGTNEGYVGFKIKTLPSVVEGDIIANTANIYFDYNAPITTNTNTVVVFNPLTNADFTFEKLFTIAPIPTKDSLAITVKGDAVISSVSIYNALGQLVQVNAHPNNTIDVSGLRAGTYFITISSDKGSATGKFIKE